MPKYLVQGSYTSEGAKGIIKGGGSARRAAVRQMLEGMEGKLEAFYFAFGGDDVVVIFDAPNNVSVAAVALAVNAAGAAHLRTTVLLTPEEVDQATQMAVGYRPPGQ